MIPLKIKSQNYFKSGKIISIYSSTNTSQCCIFQIWHGVISTIIIVFESKYISTIDFNLIAIVFDITVSVDVS